MQALDPEMRHGRFPLVLTSTSKLMQSPAMEYLEEQLTKIRDAQTPRTS
jgi:hypothetical protein